MAPIRAWAPIRGNTVFENQRCFRFWQECAMRHAEGLSPVNVIFTHLEIVI